MRIPRLVAILIVIATISTLALAQKQIILTSDNEADLLLSISLSLAMEKSVPVAVTPWGNFEESVLEAVLRYRPDIVYIIGGPMAVPEEYADGIRAKGISVIRLGGRTRQQTSLAVYQRFSNLPVIPLLCDGREPVATEGVIPIYFFDDPSEIDSFLEREGEHVICLEQERILEFSRKHGLRSLEFRMEFRLEAGNLVEKVLEVCRLFGYAPADRILHFARSETSELHRSLSPLLAEVEKKPQTLGKLEISGPSRITLGEEAAFKVEVAGTPIGGAKVYYLRIESEQQVVDPEHVVEAGTLAGETDQSGIVGVKPKEPGIYAIAAYKDRFEVSNVVVLRVEETPKIGKLKLLAPSSVPRRTMVTLRVKFGDKPVEGATIHALLVESLEQTITPDIVISRGDVLGKTNEDGELSHIFYESGYYALIATKEGYEPSDVTLLEVGG